MNSGINNNKLDLHIWLTLPSLVIVDLTIATTVALLKGLHVPKGQIICKHYSEFTGGVVYHPMLIGEDYIYKVLPYMEC